MRSGTSNYPESDPNDKSKDLRIAMAIPQLFSSVVFHIISKKNISKVGAFL